MESSGFEPVALVAAVVGVAVLGSGSHAVSAAVGDIAILMALFAFDGEGARSSGQSVAFAGVGGLCLLSPIFFLASAVLGATPPSDTTPWLLAGAWAVAALIVFAVDRFRMSARENVTLAGSGLAGATPVPFVQTAPPSTYRPAPIRVEQPAYAPPAYVPPPAPPAPSFVTEVPPVVPFPAASAPVMATVMTQPDVTAIPPGREAIIYLNLVGEGLNVLRTVRAESLGRDYFRIADVMPESEQWEFTPGQVVKCRKKSLSNGKHMVAFEEAPRAQ